MQRAGEAADAAQRSRAARVRAGAANLEQREAHNTASAPWREMGEVQRKRAVFGVAAEALLVKPAAVGH